MTMLQIIAGLLAAYSIPLLMLLLAPGALGGQPWAILGCRICGWVGMAVVTVGLVVYAVTS